MALTLLLSCESKPQGPFTEESIQEYISLLPAGEETRQEDYVVGKVVAINTGDALSHDYETAFTRDDEFAIKPGTVSTVQDKLTPGLRAADPTQVGTAVILEWKKIVLGKNLVGIEFVQAECNVTLVDVTKRAIIGRRTFAGSKPEGTHRWGSSPESDIADYINKLPRRTPETTLLSESSEPASKPPVDSELQRLFSERIASPVRLVLKDGAGTLWALESSGIQEVSGNNILIAKDTFVAIGTRVGDGLPLAEIAQKLARQLDMPFGGENFMTVDKDEVFIVAGQTGKTTEVNEIDVQDIVLIEVEEEDGAKQPADDLLAEEWSEERQEEEIRRMKEEARELEEELRKLEEGN